MSCTPTDPTAPNLLTHFQTVEDPRQEGKVLYPRYPRAQSNRLEKLLAKLYFYESKC